MLKNPHVTLQLVVCIHSSAFADSTRCGSCSTVLCIYWKKKSAYKWTCEVKTHVVQGSTVFPYMIKKKNSASLLIVVCWLRLETWSYTIRYTK